MFGKWIHQIGIRNSSISSEYGKALKYCSLIIKPSSLAPKLEFVIGMYNAIFNYDDKKYTSVSLRCYKFRDRAVQQLKRLDE